ncbi:TrkH family potassium uptake protein [Mechercharimyces sp. CAU 1602]|uniref:TrkH family potassium uptake protein n=1 Tax=Mechercharimyces sp. CAU 1602 TaxID=2973933 RepID=UPI002161F19B|nr:potassium transporter TrkG [Mechercharimyces sp. CAU 1602]MCS1350400.1 hypothetical protein [Mechercharimyces sp. CAU 1602]
MSLRYRLKPIQVIALGYVLLSLISAFLLALPITHEAGRSLSFIDALFVAASAVSVTGLTVVNVSETFNLFGEIVLLFTIQLGGIGMMTLGAVIWLILGKKIGLRDRMLIQWDQNQITLSGLVALIQKILLIALLFEGIGALVLGTYFLRFYAWDTAYYYGIYHSITGFTHAGFDLFGNSLIDFRHDVVVNGTMMVLLFFGGIGFPVIIELFSYRLRRKLSLHSRFSLWIYCLLWGVGFLFFLAMEYNKSLAGEAWHHKIMMAMFQSLTTRSGGFSTLDISTLQLPTLLVFSFLMFIGASPSSSGGGIRTTTFGTVYLAVKSYAKGTSDVNVFGRMLDFYDVRKSFVVSVFGVALVTGAVTVLSITESFELRLLIFEAASAFGTCGLSVGIVDQFSSIGKGVLIVLMLTGRVGFGTILLLVQKQTHHCPPFRYPKERIIVG